MVRPPHRHQGVTLHQNRAPWPFLPVILLRQIAAQLQSRFFACHLDVPEQTTESELPQSALTTEVNDNHPAPGPCPTTAVEQPITSTSAQHSSEASSVPHNNSGHVSRAGRIRKIRAVNLNSCICGVVILESDIKSGDTVMKCRVPGCETTWVRKQQICFMISLLTCPLVPSGLHELRI